MIHAAIPSRVTASHPNSKVKLDRDQVVLRWGTTREGWLPHVLFVFSLPSFPPIFFHIFLYSLRSFFSSSILFRFSMTFLCQSFPFSPFPSSWRSHKPLFTSFFSLTRGHGSWHVSPFSECVSSSPPRTGSRFLPNSGVFSPKFILMVFWMVFCAYYGYNQWYFTHVFVRLFFATTASNTIPSTNCSDATCRVCHGTSSASEH